MSHFVVSVLLEGSHDPQLSPDAERWMEVVTLVDADSEAVARQKAMQMSTQYESTYESMTGGMVTWKIAGCAGVWQTQLQPRIDVELFSRVLRASEGRSLLVPFED